jgi:hypothetical protein
MDDFHLGDRIFWIPSCRIGIIIDLLDYEGERLGIIGVMLDTPKEFKSLDAIECNRFEPSTYESADDPHISWLDGNSRLGNDVY